MPKVSLSHLDNPRVVSFTYELERTDGVPLFEEDAPALEFDTPDFQGRLGGGLLILYPKAHFTDLEEAHVLAANFVRAYEISGGLALRRPGFRFKYHGFHATGTSREDGKPVEHFGAVTPFIVTVELDGTFPSDVYPSPPPVSSASFEADAISTRYDRFRQGKEPLLTMANYCLTVLEGGELIDGKNKRESAEQRHSIDYLILDRIGKWAATKGDVVSGRKFNPDGSPLAADEEAWVRGAIEAIIKHLLIRTPGAWLMMKEDFR